MLYFAIMPPNVERKGKPGEGINLTQSERSNLLGEIQRASIGTRVRSAVNTMVHVWYPSLFVIADTERRKITDDDRNSFVYGIPFASSVVRPAEIQRAGGTIAIDALTVQGEPTISDFYRGISVTYHRSGKSANQASVFLNRRCIVGDRAYSPNSLGLFTSPEGLIQDVEEVSAVLAIVDFIDAGITLTTGGLSQARRAKETQQELQDLLRGKGIHDEVINRLPKDIKEILPVSDK